MRYKSLAAGYLVKKGKVLLVHHKKFNKWAPPGGHIEEDETPDEAVIREWKEELYVDIEIIPAHESAFSGDKNTRAIPMPFYIDLERDEVFDVPHVGYFFYVKMVGDKKIVNVLKKELYEAKWFAKEELPKLVTFNQVKALAEYAIDHYPS
jgi:8-oxo-dGTP pyrophosphatase MutT (NUDIX family)